MSERHTHASAHGRPKWPVRAMVTCALLTAVSVVLARFLIPTPNEVTRFSLEAVPIFLAGMLFGPLPGALTGSPPISSAACSPPMATTRFSACPRSCTACAPGFSGPG